MSIHSTYDLKLKNLLSFIINECFRSFRYPSLCEQGANFIRNNRERIISRYAENAAKVAEFMGPSTEAIFLIEPDFW
jgi:hypothetical protein